VRSSRRWPRRRCRPRSRPFAERTLPGAESVVRVRRRSLPCATASEKGPSVPPGSGAGDGEPPGPAGTDTTAPNFALAPGGVPRRRARSGNHRAGGVCGCLRGFGHAHTARAKARSLGLRLPRRRGLASASSFTLASATARLPAGRPRAVTMRLPRSVRAALRDERSVSATLAFKIPGGGRTLLPRRPITLSRAAGLRRVVGRAIRLGGICSEPCTIRGRLALSRREARRVRLRTRSTGPVTVAAGTVRASSPPATLALRVGRACRRALRRARSSAKPTLEALIRGATGPEERATRRLVLRR
jgi:hypothetical protein